MPEPSKEELRKVVVYLIKVTLTEMWSFVTSQVYFGRTTILKDANLKEVTSRMVRQELEVNFICSGRPISPKLAAIFGADVLPRQEVIAMVWPIIKDNNNCLKISHTKKYSLCHKICLLGKSLSCNV